MRGFISAFAVASLLAVSACSTFDFLGSSDEAPPLEGERISILELQKDLQPDSDQGGPGFIAPPIWQNKFWPQAGGYPNHSMQSLSLNPGELERAWEADIGEGGEDDLPLTAQPIVAAGAVFTLDTELYLSAFSVRDGQEVWRVFVGNPDEEDLVISGGISYSGGMLFVTTGYNEVLAVKPETGNVLWRAKLNAPTRAAPTALDSRVFVSTLNNTVLALNAADGQVLWEYSGMNESTSILGAASPAVNNDIVVPAFSSGEIYALRVENGSVAWTDNLSSVRRFGGLSALTDIRGLPVIDNGIVIAISFGGKLVAIDQRTGARVWQRDIGGSETPWVAGNTVFVISSDSTLIALSRKDGTIRWIKQLQRFGDMEDREDPIFWTGPVLAGGRLIMASSEGQVVEADPATGELIRHWDADVSITTPPVVAGDTLYLLGNNGSLLAYR